MTEPREPLTREQVAATRRFADDELHGNTIALCDSHELLRARLEEAKTDIADLEAGITAQDEVLTARINAEFERAERAERDVADARADWTKQRHRAEKAERERDNLHELLAHAGGHAESLIEAHARIRVLETDNAQLRAALADYGEHTSGCVLSRFEAGRPTSDGGYECCYAGKWYEMKPVDRTPACECGLSAALSPDPEVKP